MSRPCGSGRAFTYPFMPTGMTARPGTGKPAIPLHAAASSPSAVADPGGRQDIHPALHTHQPDTLMRRARWQRTGDPDMIPATMHAGAG
ncbi:hypothetical protein CFR80_11985 [Komagataeibacter oboediens]|uniref:Uncharacterized protein n=1 Tax=Komagataeibacter oboediens TaxID=65958 RepID=A0A318QSN3_9PROT|nr:hypothetical protein [Komagataeibacter oboediens]PYD81380.1 hypothetical protein CFR80_11985 [Komagataeibacter oboediens]